MTEIQEPNFSLNLPGEWQRIDNAETGSFTYQQTNGAAIVTVLLLRVRPVYAIADRKRLMDDYLKHRSTYEQGQDPTMVAYAPFSSQFEDSVEGGWAAVDVAGDRRAIHRTVLQGNMLIDLRYDAVGLDEAQFASAAAAVLGTATISVDSPEAEIE